MPASGTCCAAGSPSISRRPRRPSARPPAPPGISPARRRRAMQRDGRVNSGDVSIFYRAFGTPGRAPILLMHGSNYYDSYDWIGVASALATDRLVVTPDRRGWGETTWSPSKDYSRDALVDDMLAVMRATQ